MAKKGIVTIDQRLCKACGICIEFCPKKVLAAEEPLLKAKVADPDACTACNMCMLYCPDWAINVAEVGGDGK
ncbi:MAG TPA: 4Fe-4S binding protein [Bacillota bacterium]